MNVWIVTADLMQIKIITKTFFLCYTSLCFDWFNKYTVATDELLCLKNAGIIPNSDIDFLDTYAEEKHIKQCVPRTRNVDDDLGELC